MVDEKKLEEAFKLIIEALGDDPKREGLIETPHRAASMYMEMFNGMNYTNDELIELFNKTFDEDYLTDSKNLVVIKDIDIFSYCEHHIALMYDMTCDIDWHAWETLSKKDGNFIFIKEHLMGHRVHAESETTKTISENRRTKEDLEIFKRFWPEWFAKKINKFYSKSEDSNKI